MREAHRTIRRSRRRINVSRLPYSRRILAVSWSTRGLPGVPRIGKNSGTTVWKLIVTVACTCESGGQAVVEQVTDTLAAVRFAALSTSLMRVRAGPLSNVGLAGSGGGVTTPT